MLYLHHIHPQELHQFSQAEIVRPGPGMVLLEQAPELGALLSHDMYDMGKTGDHTVL